MTKPLHPPADASDIMPRLGAGVAAMLARARAALTAGEILILVGLAATVAGVAQIYAPAGLIFGGLLATALGVGALRRGR